MKIIGVDLHARQQTIAMLDTDTGELVEKTLEHAGDEVRKFYSTLSGQVVVGIEATGSLMNGLRRGHALWGQVGQHELPSATARSLCESTTNSPAELISRFQESIEELDRQVREEAAQRPQARRLLTHPGVGPVTALARPALLAHRLPASQISGNRYPLSC
jgi:hypothetical protein